MPRTLRYGLKSLYHSVLLPLTYKSVTRKDEAVLKSLGLDVAPPAAMRHRVHGEPDLASFLAVGKQNFEAIQTGLEMAGVTLTPETNVLDFGSGSGRTLLWWLKSSPPHPNLFATDIDREAIGWVKAHLPVTTNVNQLKPPLPYADGQMDVVYAVSVLTHLDEGDQDAWLGEFRRITRPGGVLLLSIHSELGNSILSEAERTELSTRGFVFRQDYTIASKIFGQGYQNSYHSDDYIKRHWGSFFTILGRVSMGRQDFIVMRAK